MVSGCFLVIYIPKVLLFSFLTNFYKFYLSVPGTKIIGISMLIVVLSAVFCSRVISLQHGLRIVSGPILHLLLSFQHRCLAALMRWHCANTEPRLCLCLSSNISNWFEAINFFSYNNHENVTKLGAGTRF